MSWTVRDINVISSREFSINVVWDLDGPDELVFNNISIKLPPEGPARDAEFTRVMRELERERDRRLAIPPNANLIRQLIEDALNAPARVPGPPAGGPPGLNR